METALQTKTESSVLEIPSDISVGALEMAIGTGDFSRFTPGDKLRFLNLTCQSLRLNPLTLPIRIIKMDGREVMYATAECSAQLSARDKVSIKKTEEKTEHDCYIVRVIASTPDGRSHEDIGVVEMLYPEKTVEWRNGQKVYVPHPDAGKPFKGKDWANAVMKCHTKASRRAILRICSLGIPDESELDEMPRAQVSHVQTVLTEESVDDKLAKLNALNAPPEKTVDAEVIPQKEPEAQSFVLEQPAPPVQAVAPPQVETPVQPGVATLSDDDVAKVMEVLNRLPDQKRAIDYLIYRGWLQKGANLNTINRTDFEMMTATKNFTTFKRYVESWKGTL